MLIQKTHRLAGMTLHFRFILMCCITLFYAYTPVFASTDSHYFSNYFTQSAESISGLPSSDNPHTFHLRMDISRIQLFTQNLDILKTTAYFPDTVLVYATSQNPRRYSYFYSQNGERLISFIKSYENEEWINLSYETCTYDANGNRLTSTWQIWQNSAWTNSSKFTYTYTTNNKIATQTRQLWTASGWTNDEKVTNTYDIFGNRVAYKLEKWLDNNWSNNVYELYTYDDQNNMVNGVRQVWNAVYWLNDQRYIYTYNDLGQLLNAEIQNWSDDEWVNFYSESYTYSENRLSSYTGMIWVGANWTNSEKYTYTYNAPGFLTEAVGEEWSNGQWTNDIRSQFSHNSFGGVQSGLYQIWGAGQWHNEHLTDYSYDNSGNTTELNLFYWDGNTWVQNADGLLQLLFSQSISSMYFTGYRAYASYISTLVDLPEKTREIEISVMPNPVNNHFTIKLGMLQEQILIHLHAIDGKIISKLYEGDAALMPNQFDVKKLDLPEGVYLLSINSIKKTYYKKLVIK